MMIISEINIAASAMTDDDVTISDMQKYEAITEHELYDAVKRTAMSVVENIQLETQGKMKILVEMMKGNNGFPLAEITSNKKITNVVFCYEEEG
jgi:hypothetical protein